MQERKTAVGLRRGNLSKAGEGLAGSSYIFASVFQIGAHELKLNSIQIKPDNGVPRPPSRWMKNILILFSID